MADDKKYYYLKLKESFFDTDEIVLLESMQDGHLYSNILLKLYLKSLKNEGKLMFNDRIPYSPGMLAQLTRHSVGTVEKALNIFSELGLIEVIDTGAIFISDIHNFIGKSSTEADRKREYRDRIDSEKCLNGQMSRQLSDKNPPELEIELKIEKEKSIVPPKVKPVEFDNNSFEMKIVEGFILHLRERIPTFKEPNKQKWAKEIDLMIRVDKRDKQDIVNVLKFAINDSFWSTNILSTSKFRKQYDQLYVKMNSGFNIKKEVSQEWEAI